MPIKATDHLNLEENISDGASHHDGQSQHLPLNTQSMHELAIPPQSPIRLARHFFVHLTVRLTFSILLGCSDAAHNSSHMDGFPLPADGVPCKTVPGLAGYLSWFLGITEPQLRKSFMLFLGAWVFVIWTPS